MMNDMMYFDGTRFEDLPNELFRLIFEYLAPHDLIRAFKKLNRRFKSMVSKQPLSLPSNRSMPYKLYDNYLTKIIPKYASQFVYLHLSERRAPHAVDLFISEVPLEDEFWPALKAVTMEDVPREVFETLLADCSLLFNIQSLTLNVSFGRYHYDEYNECDDFGLIMPILNSLSELRSLYLRIKNHSVIYDSLNERRSMTHIHENLRILYINDCSRELLVELLSNGYLPNLRRLRVGLSCQRHSDMVIEPPNPLPLKQVSASELRHVTIKLFVGVTWVLTFFEELQRHSQLDYLNLSGHVRFTNHSNFPRATELERWLKLSKSDVFQFRMKLSADAVQDAQSFQEDIFAEYRRATGIEYSARWREINICHPEMSFSYPDIMDESSSSVSSNDSTSDESEEMDDDHTSNSSSRTEEWVRGDPLDKNAEELIFNEFDYVNTGLFKELEAIHCWPRLRKISIEYDPFPPEDYVVGKRLTRLGYVIERSPRLREFFIEHHLDYGRELALNAQFSRLLTSKLEVFHYTTIKSNSSLADLARVVITLFNHSILPPCLKELTLNVDGHPSIWLSTEHLVRWIGKLFKHFPKLIHFTLYCQPIELYENSEYNLSNFASEWYVLSCLRQRLRSSTLQYRHKPHSLDIWL